MKGVIEEVKNKVLLVFQSQQYCDKWMSEDYSFDVLKLNYHYNGKKPTMNRAMSFLKDDFTYKIDIISTQSMLGRNTSIFIMFQLLE